MEPPAPTEAERIRATYRDRDATAVVASPWLDVGYVLRMQELERALLLALADAGIDPQRLEVLEVGCGSGYFLSRFRDYGAMTTAGIDLSESRVAAARTRDPRLDVVAGDASALPWADASFDVVAQFTCLSSVLDSDMRRRIAAEMWRVLRPGGAILSYDIARTPFLARALRRAAALRRGGEAGGTATAPVPREELAELFPDAALRLRRLTLAVDIAALAARNALLARTAAASPILRTHLLAIGVKPG